MYIRYMYLYVSVFMNVHTRWRFVLNHVISRKADDLFGDQDVWRRVDDRDRREIFDDVVHMLAKKEKVWKIVT